MTRPYRFLSSITKSSPPESPDEVSMKSDFVYILAALLCALVCVTGLITVAYFACRRHRSTANLTSRQRSANKGIKKKVVEAIPKFMYDSAKVDTGRNLSSDDCVICLADYEDGDEIRVLPQCGHKFHAGCIDKWLGSHSSCPSCRKILVISKCNKCGEIPTIAAGKISPVKEDDEGQHVSK